MTQVRLEPAASRSRVKHSTTESLCSLFHNEEISMFQSFYKLADGAYPQGIPSRCKCIIFTNNILVAISLDVDSLLIVNQKNGFMLTRLRQCQS